MSKYILKDGEPVLATDIIHWATWFEKASTNKERTVAKDKIGEAVVSTVFLGIDHSWDGGPPVLWETMIFGGKHDDYQERYSSLKDAEAGHKVAVNLVKGDK